jgi:hypothetical protein
MILIMQERVHDFETWKTVFDRGEEFRTKHGCSGHVILRVARGAAGDGGAGFASGPIGAGYGGGSRGLIDLAEGEDLVVQLRFPSREAIEAYLMDPHLTSNLERAGVMGRPAVFMAREEETRLYVIPAAA